MASTVYPFGISGIETCGMDEQKTHSCVRTPEFARNAYLCNYLPSQIICVGTREKKHFRYLNICIQNGQKHDFVPAA